MDLLCKFILCSDLYRTHIYIYIYKFIRSSITNSMLNYRKVEHNVTADYSTIDWKKTHALWKCKDSIELESQSTSIRIGII